MTIVMVRHRCCQCHHRSLLNGVPLSMIYNVNYSSRASLAENVMLLYIGIGTHDAIVPDLRLALLLNVYT